jgi:hypothetical protein
MQLTGKMALSRLRCLIPLGFRSFQKESQECGTRLIQMPPMAAVDFTGTQQRQPFDAWDAERLRNRQRFAGEVPHVRDPRSAVASSVRTLGIRYVACLRSGIPFCELASPALALGPFAGTSICIH